MCATLRVREPPVVPCTPCRGVSGSGDGADWVWEGQDGLAADRVGGRMRRTKRMRSTFTLANPRIQGMGRPQILGFCGIVVLANLPGMGGGGVAGALFPRVQFCSVVPAV